MTSYVEIWESKEDYEYHRNYNGDGEDPKEPKFVFAYDNFKWMEKYISNHQKFWKIWELFQMAADGCRVVENESWKGPHPDHDNLKFMDKDFWKLTEIIPFGSNFIAVCYINKQFL